MSTKLLILAFNLPIFFLGAGQIFLDNHTIPKPRRLSFEKITPLTSQTKLEEQPYLSPSLANRRGKENECRHVGICER
ncbi:hypothetical protein [Lyngbya aestuarii]|uniref:hypothetical protein n=1 Tax=Lyngbya aestuarii TaxID=118322 RepID=UPI00403D68A2